MLKIPRLPFDKFTTASRTLGTQMKATGEVMAIANSFEGALMKAIRSLELNVRALKLERFRTPVPQELSLDLRENRRVKSAASAFLGLRRSFFLHQLQCFFTVIGSSHNLKLVVFLFYNIDDQTGCHRLIINDHHLIHRLRPPFPILL